MKQQTLGLSTGLAIALGAGILLAGSIGGFFIFNNYIYNEKQAEEGLTQEQVQTLVSIYMHEHISLLSPEPAVLGGTFFVTDIKFTTGNKGIVEYEDGHIALMADFEYFMNNGEVVGVDLTNVRELQP